MAPYVIIQMEFSPTPPKSATNVRFFDVQKNTPEILLRPTLLNASNGTIYQYDIVEKESLELCKDKEPDELAVVDGLLYFSNNEGLYSVPVNGKAPVSCVVKDEALTKYVVCDNEIYYKRELSAEDTDWLEYGA